MLYNAFSILKANLFATKNKTMKKSIYLSILLCVFMTISGITKTTLAQNNKSDYALLSGDVKNFEGHKAAINIVNGNRVLPIEFDEKGHFENRIMMKDISYVRVVIGKATVPVYLAPKVKLRLRFDVENVLKGDYSKVKIKGNASAETKMLLVYYTSQAFPDSQTAFKLTPVDFKNKMVEVSEHNLAIIDKFAKKHKSINSKFVSMFKLQSLVSLTPFIYSYPMYHSMMVPNDKSEYPEGFNIIDSKLPKNDIYVYNSVYRYKIYEVSYWNNYLLAKVNNLKSDLARFFNAYIDELLSLKLNSQIQDDVANNMIMQNYGAVPENVKKIFRSRYKELISSPDYLDQISSMINS